MRSAKHLVSPWRIGVDIGGTFTGAVVGDSRGRLVAKKSLSIPKDPAAGFFAALAAVAQAAAVSTRELLAGCAALIHGSTIATNTVLEGKVARVGLFCTSGF